MKKVYIILILFLTLSLNISTASDNTRYILVPMDSEQENHLKAYGVTYHTLKLGYKCYWLLNYRYGSFLLPNTKIVRKMAVAQGVTYKKLTRRDMQKIDYTIKVENMEKVELTKAPKVAVYTPIKENGSPINEPWDDAVTLVLTYAKIPYTPIYDKHILKGDLDKYDWLHLHHEDFTGQYGKFYKHFHYKPWYIKKVMEAEKSAKKAGYKSVQTHKCAVAKKIKQYVKSGKFLFAMCAAVDTLDIALACEGTDIVDSRIDNTPIDSDYKKKIDYSKCLAFQNFDLITDPNIYEFSSIDIDVNNTKIKETDVFSLFEYSAKIDLIPTILTQCHKRHIKEFYGQTTGFYKKNVNREKNNKQIKNYIKILGENKKYGYVKYLYSDYGKGFFTFYAGHDPEDFKHLIYDPPTKLEFHPNSPGYRLILNNILFPAAKKKKRKT